MRKMRLIFGFTALALLSACKWFATDSNSTAASATLTVAVTAQPGVGVTYTGTVTFAGQVTSPSSSQSSGVFSCFGTKSGCEFFSIPQALTASFPSGNLNGQATAVFIAQSLDPGRWNVSMTVGSTETAGQGNTFNYCSLNVLAGQLNILNLSLPAGSGTLNNASVSPSPGCGQ